MHCISSANSRHTPYQEKTAKIDKSEIASSHHFFHEHFEHRNMVILDHKKSGNPSLILIYKIS
jgi:hypothetical protein